MESETVAIPELRENLAAYLEGGRPLTITNQGETVGFFVPVRRVRQADVEAVREKMKRIDAIVESWGATEEELMAEYQEIERAARMGANRN